MARDCALIDSRLDTAKICSDGRVHVDHAQPLAVFGGEKTFSHGLDLKRKSRRLACALRASSVKEPDGLLEIAIKNAIFGRELSTLNVMVKKIAKSKPL
jgi:hypothetical protein